MKKTIKVKGMHCHGCEMLIKLSLKEIEGINEVGVSYQKGEVEIEYDEGQVDLKKILEVIEENGYEPQEV